MMNALSEHVVSIVAFVVTIGTGIWLSQLGRPLNGVLFTVHKLVALGAVLAVTIPIFGMLRSAPAPTLAITFLILGGIGVVGLFATGALISLNHTAIALTWIHRIAPIVVLLATGWAIYLLGKS